MLKAWNFTKNKFRQRCFDYNLSKSFRTNIFDNATIQMLLKVTLMVGLYLVNYSSLKWCYLYTCCLRDISVWILTTFSYPPVDPHFGPSQATKMDLFTRLINGFKLTFSTMFARSSIVDIWRGPEFIKCFKIYE